MLVVTDHYKLVTIDTFLAESGVLLLTRLLHHGFIGRGEHVRDAGQAEGGATAGHDLR